MSISKFCTGEPEAATLDLPGKGPVARVHATLTFRPTECSSDAAADVERDAFGFEIAPLQRDGYRAHKDVLHTYGNDDRLRVEELLETGLFVNRQQVRPLLVSSGSTNAQSRIEMQRRWSALPAGTSRHHQQDWKRAVIKGVPMVHRGEVWLVSSQLKDRLLRERASYKSALFQHPAARLSSLSAAKLWRVLPIQRSPFQGLKMPVRSARRLSPLTIFS